MARLEAPEAIQRFRDNEDRLDRFINGTEGVTYTTSDGRTVPSIKKLVFDFSTTLNLAGNGWLALAQEAANTATEQAEEVQQVYDNAVAFNTSLTASINAVNQSKAEAQAWATSMDPLPGGLRSARWYAENLSAGTVISFNGRSGVIMPQPDDYTVDMLVYTEDVSLRQALDNIFQALSQIGTTVDQLFADVFALKNNFTVSAEPPPETGTEGAFWYQLEEV